MPWREADPVSERARFVGEHASGYWTMTELCERFGISRATGHKWVRRWRLERSLAERPRAPRSCPHRTPREVEELIVELRRKRPGWGAITLRQRLAKLHPGLALPAPATIAEIIDRHGLVQPRRPRRRPRHPGKPYIGATSPNDVWCTDFKGQFKMGDGRLCYPLTVTDFTSRYLLGCHGLRTTEQRGVKTAFTHWFRDYGLPRQILSDNGVPFATQGIGGLSRLAVWWIRLGIHPIRIEPGKPAQNGRHERMHKRSSTTPPGRRRAAWRPSSGSSTASARSTTRSVPTARSTGRPQRLSTSPRHVRIRSVCRRWSTPPTTKCAWSVATAASSGTSASCTSAGCSSASGSASRRSLTASGL